ncbi:MAG TPA: hypothetical protein VGM85_11420 [Paraburkholderia sp.]|jgi:hypothetical protein
MTQPNSQQLNALVAQPVRATVGGVSAPAPSMRTVALSLLVDRALSA